MKTSFIHAAKTALFLLLVSGLFVSCDNSTGSEDEEQEPIAIRVKQNNQTVLEKNNETNTTTGTLSLTNGTTTSFTVLFVDEAGAEFTPDPEEHSIVLSGGSSVVTFANVNSDTAPFSFDAQATSVGQATFQIAMNHVGTAEFTATNLPVVVNSAN